MSILIVHKFGKFNFTFKNNSLRFYFVNLKTQINAIEPKIAIGYSIYNRLFESEIIKKSAIKERHAQGNTIFLATHNSRDETISSNTGILIKRGVKNLADAITLLKDNHELRRTLGTQGRMKALNFNWSSISKHYYENYEKITQS